MNPYTRNLPELSEDEISWSSIEGESLGGYAEARVTIHQTSLKDRIYLHLEHEDIGSTIVYFTVEQAAKIARLILSQSAVEDFLNKKSRKDFEEDKFA